MREKYVSARGVFYDLAKSPYEYIDNNGKVFKFSSLKKLDIFNKKVQEREHAWNAEMLRLKNLGYEITKSYLDNKNRLPELIYNAMIKK